MKNFFLLIVFVALFNQSFAQDSCSHKCKELKHGIQFQVTNIFNLTNFDGYTFSYRYLFNRNSGIRIGLYTQLSYEKEDITQRLDSLTNNPPNKYDHYNFKISIQYLHSLVSYRDFDLIVGGGPFISFYKSEGYSESLSQSSLRKYNEKNNGTGFGLDLILGVEYKLASNIILSGEYGVSILRDNSEIEYNAIYEYETYTQTASQVGKINRTIINSAGVNLGIAIFF
jgi:opacity protein-like surface antigen